MEEPAPLGLICLFVAVPLGGRPPRPPSPSPPADSQGNQSLPKHNSNYTTGEDISDYDNLNPLLIFAMLAPDPHPHICTYLKQRFLTGNTNTLCTPSLAPNSLKSTIRPLLSVNIPLSYCCLYIANYLV